jgi:hypothetical protein
MFDRRRKRLGRSCDRQENFVLSSNRFYVAAETGAYHVPRRALLATLCAVMTACAFAIAAFFIGTYLLAPAPLAAAPLPLAAPASWKIEGALTEACTCKVPCTCNFGEGPSPHSYCYALYSYEIRKGRYNDVTLDGMHFGATDLEHGRTVFIEARADEKQRQALRVIIARMIERSPANEAEERAEELAKDVRYVAIKQEYDDRRNHLAVAGIGEFSANYIMGLDSTQPLVVRNNTTWRIRESIKAKTSAYRVKVGKDSVNTKDTNSNQGDFEYTDKMDFDASAEWSCGAKMSEKSKSGKGEAMCGERKSGGRR